MEFNFDNIYQFWADQSQKGYSVEILQVYHSQCQVKVHLGVCILQSLKNLSTFGVEISHQLNREVPHSLVRSYASLNVNK